MLSELQARSAGVPFTERDFSGNRRRCEGRFPRVPIGEKPRKFGDFGELTAVGFAVGNCGVCVGAMAAKKRPKQQPADPRRETLEQARATLRELESELAETAQKWVGTAGTLIALGEPTDFDRAMTIARVLRALTNSDVRDEVAKKLGHAVTPFLEASFPAGGFPLEPFPGKHKRARRAWLSAMKRGFALHLHWSDPNRIEELHARNWDAEKTGGPEFVPIERDTEESFPRFIVNTLSGMAHTIGAQFGYATSLSLRSMGKSLSVGNDEELVALKARLLPQVQQALLNKRPTQSWEDFAEECLILFFVAVGMTRKQAENLTRT